MKRQHLCSLLFAVCLAAALCSIASAQSLNKKAIRQQLEHKVLLLRGRYVCDIPISAQIQFKTSGNGATKPTGTQIGTSNCNLSFDATGKLTSHAEKGPFALSAVQIERVHFKPQAVVLQVERKLILQENPASGPSILTLQPAKELQIAIAINPAQPESLQAALKAIFADSVSQALSSEPQRERETDLASLPVAAAQADDTQKPEPNQVNIGSPGKHVVPIAGTHDYITAPRPLYAPSPHYTRKAREHKVQGECDISLIVNKKGFPEDLRIVRSLPDGLDEQAIKTVKHYRFSPALVDGKPVSVRLIVEVDFHLYNSNRQ